MPTFKKRILSINKDMAHVMRKFVTGDYGDIIFSKGIRSLNCGEGIMGYSENNLTTPVFERKLIKVNKYCKKFMKDRKLHDQEKLGLEIVLTRDIFELLYGKDIKAFKNNHPEYSLELKTYFINYLND